MPTIYCFEPIADHQAEILILGSMPGQASLSANQYYAHRQNAFWRIMAELLQFNPEAPYEEKTEALKSTRIALWDVLKSCQRQGSLDARIEKESQTVNDFQSFFRIHPKITQVFFNGGKAEACFRQYVLQKNNFSFSTTQFTRLPSTSPANARLSFADKRKMWRQLLITGIR